MTSVIDPSKGIVFCEGCPDGVDSLLLGHLLPVGKVVIKPVGGKHGMRAFIEGHLKGYSDAEPGYLAFRDRDFDIEPPDSIELIRLEGEKPIWLSHRASIESYFVDADLIHQYWAARETAPKWQHGPAPSKDDIRQHIIESARELADYQSVRWALAKLKPGARWPEICTTWTKNGSGNLPTSLTYEDCIEQACELVQDFQAQIEGICLACLQEYSQEYRERFGDESFFDKSGYLRWFHGKDLLVKLCQRLAANFPRRHFKRWAAENMNPQKYPDLQQLIRLVSGLA